MGNVFATLHSWKSNGKARGDHPPLQRGTTPPREGPPPWISTLLGGHAETGRRVPKVGEEGGSGWGGGGSPAGEVVVANGEKKQEEVGAGGGGGGEYGEEEGARAGWRW